MREFRNTRLGQYELLGLIGQSHDGRSYQARCITDAVPGLKQGNLVELKIFEERPCKAFRERVEVLRSLTHPNIVQYLDSFFFHNEDLDDDGYGIVTELLKPKPTLIGRINGRNRQNRNGLDPKEVLPLFIGYLDGLEYLHQNGIIHRGINPFNLHVPEGEANKAKILDLGEEFESGNLTTPESMPGRLEASSISTEMDFTLPVLLLPSGLPYMPPEFLTHRGGRGCPQSDVYSLGVTLYKALTGKLPVYLGPAGKHAAWTAFLQRREKPQADWNHPVFVKYPGLISLLRRAMAPDPRLRYESAAMMRCDIQASV